MRTGRGRATLSATAVGVGVGLVHLVMTAWVQAPIVQPDELGYIDNARRLALGGARPVTGYYPGASALFAPLWHITRSPIDVWRGALLVNSALCGLIAVVTWLLIPRLGFSSRHRVLVTLVVAAYPAIVLYSNVSMSESLFALGCAGVALITAWCFSALGPWSASPGPLRWIVLGASAGLLTAVHPRGLAVAIAVVVVSAIALQPWRPTTWARPAAWGRLLGLVAGIVLGLALTRLLLVAVRPATGTGLGSYRADAVVGRVSAHGAPRLLLMGLAGQLLYLTVATAGLAPLGLVLGLVDLVSLARRRVAASAAVVARAAVGVSALGILAMSVLFLNGGDRADQLIYGRYNEGAIVGLLVVGATWMLGAASVTPWRRQLMWFGVAGTTFAVGVIVLAIGLTPGQRHAPLNQGTVLALASVLRRSGPYLDLDAIVLVGAAAIAAVAILQWRTPAVALAVVGSAFAWTSYDTFHSYIVPGSVARARQDVLATTIARATSVLHVSPSCVGFDAGVDFTYFNDRFYLPGWQVRPFDGSAGPPCGPFAISTRPNFFAFHPGSQIVSIENDLPLILYVTPGPTLETLRSAGWLLPAMVPGALPIELQEALVSATGQPTSMRAGSTSTLTVHAANVATHGNPWPNKRGLRQDGFVVRVTARWFPAGSAFTTPGQGGLAPLARSVAELPRTVLPGQHAVVHLRLDPRTENGATLPPGDYVVVVAVYQELVGTIPGGVLTIPVTIRP
ncbi:MAG: hypothetical protein ACYDD7_13545 [Acidimicrobiales bacterium]